ncbi:galactokinase [Pseudoalteromonas sp. T1lg75]|uniref:galactokinase n=1 Tax=Pseudoalteromonas sp. T1lg75 TaxID=2077102 RepID=UPI000CF6A9B7|nr:galactokinase [Pseudoalteromonas sp. T1lg75]
MAIKDKFQFLYGERAQVICHAPGRVNLMGDHTDYNLGFVLPAAINFGTDIAASKRTDNRICVTALDLDASQVIFSLDDIEFDEHQTWSNYIRGCLRALKARFPDFAGANLAISGNVPRGAGLSSSASLEMALLRAIASLYDLALDGVTAALMGQQAENEFVGCNCGIMDQLISAEGRSGRALLLDCRNLSRRYAKLPADLGILIVNSNVKRGLVDSEYNTRRRQCEAVARHLGQPSLREVTLAMLEAARHELDETDYRRARHVLGENQRTLDMLEALQAQDLKRVGSLMAESHASLKEDFAVTVAQTDALVGILTEAIGEEGGARMTGGGFGGCVVALGSKAALARAETAVRERYEALTGLTPDIYLCHAVDGAFAQKELTDN